MANVLYGLDLHISLLQLLDAQPRISLNAHIANVFVLLPRLFNPVVQSRVPGFGVPWLRAVIAEQLFDFFDGLAACFWVSVSCC